MLVAIGVAAFAAAVRYLPIMTHVEEPEMAPAAVRERAMLAPIPVRS
jgi:hypothetical protein